MNTNTEMKTLLEVYDPAMCCSTGVCGPDVDDSLADFANNMKWLKSKGVTVNRFNLGQEPQVFKDNPEVLSRLKKSGSDILPIIFINNQLVSEGGYPDRTQLANWLGITQDSGSTTGSKRSEILQGLQAAVTDADIENLRNYFVMGKQQSISVEEMVHAMQAGINNRQQTTQIVLQAANELLGVPSNGCAPGSGCC